MCSISGFTGPANLEIQSFFIKSLNHRGPDDFGVLSTESFSFSMNRLSIIDVERGKQPMTDDNSKISLIFNGEIYNYIELREVLKSLGHHFKSDSDTEVILNGYKEWGFEIVTKLSGMYSFALFDSFKDILFFARDKIGEKPFYYFFDDSGDIYFSSEFRSLYECGLLFKKLKKEVDQESMRWYFAFKSTPLDNSIHPKIKKLPQGCYMIIDLKTKKSEIINYYKIKNNVKKHTLNEPEIIEHLDFLIYSSVQRTLRSDVEIGSFLSGGLDSSLITVLASKILNKPIKTYSLVYDEEIYNKKDDQHYARLISETVNTHHTEIILDSHMYIDELPKIVDHIMQPNCAVFSNWFISKNMSKEVKVAIGGDGADELFGSYFLHRASGFIDNPNLQVYENLTENEKDFITEVKSKGFNFMVDSFSVFDKKSRDQLFLNSEFCELFNAKFNLSIRNLESKTYLNKILEYDCNHLLVNQILNYTDLLSMAHSLELRAPFLDYNLVNYCFGISSELKFKNGIPKYLLKKVAENYLPHDLIYRNKEGFVEPNIYWLKKDLEEYARDIILSENFDHINILNKKFVTRITNNFFDNNNFFEGKKVWSLLLYGIWEKKYFSI